jgi:phospholipase/carboxylesterase
VPAIELAARVRPAAVEPAGSLVLLHGRGADENDLFPLLDALDPERRLHAACPRGPLSLPPGGAHWYRLGGIPTPEPETFWRSFEALARWLHELPRPLVLGGFSQGAVMAYALTLARGRKRSAALLAFSGFLPEVDGLKLEWSGLSGFPVVIAHGTYDGVIGVEWSRSARAAFSSAGAAVSYHESPVPHTIDPTVLAPAQALVDSAIRATEAGG